MYYSTLYFYDQGEFEFFASSTLRILGPRNLRFFFLKEENLKDQFFWVLWQRTMIIQARFCKKDKKYALYDDTQEGTRMIIKNLF